MNIKNSDTLIFVVFYINLLYNICGIVINYINKYIYLFIVSYCRSIIEQQAATFFIVKFLQ